MSTRAAVTFPAIEGIHNIYFVFRNDKAEATQSLMQVTHIEFQNKAALIAKSK
jgi:hypothetical protein